MPFLEAKGMRTKTVIVGLLSVLPFATAAYADRQVTAEEEGKIAAALQAQNCEGGTMKFDDEDHYFKVEGARCEEGRIYELKFDQSFAMLEKSLDDDDDDD
ncbi:MAG: PepSY domain-containing protein [Geminicoccaceae bacterium]